jgi:predicted nucleotidyltransferase
LRQREHGRRLAELRQRLQQVLGPADCSVWLFGSLARGDWDGTSDTDLLVVAPDGAAAERWADQLRQALVGDDVLALSRERWQAMDDSPSPTGGQSVGRPCSCTRNHEPGASQGLVAPGPQ